MAGADRQGAARLIHTQIGADNAVFDFGIATEWYIIDGTLPANHLAGFCAINRAAIAIALV